MTKRQLIDQIMTVNRSARPEFLARFDDDDLHDYLDHLAVLLEPRLTGQTDRYEKYFVATTPAAAVGPDTPEREDQDDLRSADGADDAEDAAPPTGGLMPSFIYDQQHPAPISVSPAPQDDEPAETTDDEPAETLDEDNLGDDEEDIDREQAPAEADESYLASDETEDDEPVEDGDLVPVGQCADESFAETEEDTESWLF